MKMLITGGAGFIGSNLARFALNEGAEVRVLDDLSTGRLSNLQGLDVDFHEGSFLDAPNLDKAMRGADAIVHLGAIPSVPRSITEPLASHHANATGTLMLLRSATEHGVHHLSVASSSSVYGANPRLPKSENDYTSPLSPYAVSKLATEGYALAWRSSYGLPTVAFRLFNVYGPGQPADHAYAAVIPRFVDAALRHRPVTIYGDGSQSRDFTHVSNVCELLMRAAREQTTSDRPINLAFQSNTTILRLVQLLEEALGHKIQRDFAPPRPGDVKASQADSSTLQETFPGVTPISLTAGIASVIDWMKGHQQ